MTTSRLMRTAFVLVALGLMLPFNVALADDIFSPDSHPFGTKFKQWTAQWWQFVLSFPDANNPLTDATGERCGLGQRGPVWFLMGVTGFGGTATRTCSIPENKALFFPVVNLIDINAPNVTGQDQTARELRREIDPAMDAATDLSVKLDGKPLRKLEKFPDRFRVRSVVFEVTLPEDNLFGIDPGTYSPAIDDGFYVMLKPLDVGSHTLHFQGKAGPGGIIPEQFSVDVTYHLNIVPVDLE